MKSELSFLMDLFLNDDVPTAIKKLVADRIREVEEAFTMSRQPAMIGKNNISVSPASMPGMQAPSMQRIMASHPDVAVVTAVEPSSAAAAEALQKRAAIINARGSEKPEPGRSSPRKF